MFKVELNDSCLNNSPVNTPVQIMTASRTFQAMSTMVSEMNRNLMSFLSIAPRTVPPNTPLAGQSFVVTGGNRGFGRGVTLELVARGARVIIGARGTEAGTAVINEAATLYPDAPRVSYFPLDLTSFESIREFSRKIHETLGSNGLSGLVNNAGLWSSEQKFTVAKRDQPELEMTWAVNVFGLVYLTYQLQDLLLRSPPGGARIVNVASIAHLSVSKVDVDDPMSKSRPFNFIHNYAESKLAVMFYTKQLAKQLGPKGVSVYAVDPGISQTEIGSNFGTVARWAMETVIARPFMRAPIDGSRSILFPLLFPSETYHVNKWYFCDGAERTPGPQLNEEGQERAVWKLVQNMIGQQSEPEFVPSSKFNFPSE